MVHKCRAWEAELNIVIPEIFFKRMCTDIYAVTNIPKLRSFQYRLVHRAIILNSHLFHWKIVSSNECSFCHTDKETFSHIFVECAVVKEIWEKLLVHMEMYSLDKPNFSRFNVLFNKLHSKSNHVFNFICLLFKAYIYKQRCLGKALVYNEVKYSINQVRQIERYNAVIKGKLIKHEAKWGEHPTNSPEP